MPNLPITGVVLYKHGVGHFEREGPVEGNARLELTFKQGEVSDVLKSLTVLDLNGGHVASVSYDATRPLEQLLSEVALDIPDRESLVSLLPQVKGARVSLHSGVSDPVEGVILGIDRSERQTGDGIVHVVLLSIVTDEGEVRSFDLHALAGLQLLDPTLRRDLDFYLRTQLSSKKKDARTFTFFAQGEGSRRLRVSYTLEAPVWKATYRILLDSEEKPLIQGWAVVDNTQDEDWENVRLSLVAGLPVSFVHDLYTPRYVRRPEVKVQETTGVLPPEVEEGMHLLEVADKAEALMAFAPAAAMAEPVARKRGLRSAAREKAAPSSMPAQVRERKLGDLFEYEIEHPVTIRRNQSALVPIVLRPFEGRQALLYNRQTRPDNPLRCVEFRNTTGLTLEGGPVTVLEKGSYVGEAMLDTLVPDVEKLIPFAVELSVRILDNVESHDERVHKVVARQGTLHIFQQRVQQTTYHLDNRSDQEKVLYLEHPRGGAEQQLFGPTEPKETTENYWRFRLILPPREITRFVVRQRTPLQQSFLLLQADEGQLGMWLERKYFTPAAENLLRQIMEVRQEIQRIDHRLEVADRERNWIHNEQKRIRENLQTLGDRSSEKELRERFVKTLDEQEDRLKVLEREASTLRQRREEATEKLNVVLAKVDFELDL